MWQGKHIGARGLGHEGALTFLPETFTHCPNGSGLKSGCKRTKITWKTKTFTISTSKETAIIPKRIVLKACILNMASSNSVNPVKSKNMFLEITPTLLFCNAFPQVSLPESRAFFPKIHRSWGGGRRMCSLPSSYTYGQTLEFRDVWLKATLGFECFPSFHSFIKYRGILLEDIQIVFAVLKLLNDLQEVARSGSVLELDVKLDWHAIFVKALHVRICNGLEHALEDYEFVTWRTSVKTFPLHGVWQCFLMDIVGYTHW